MFAPTVALALLVGAPPAGVSSAKLNAAPEGLKVQGAFHAGRSFEDAGGAHVVILSQQEGAGSRTLHALLADRVKGGFKVVRALKDWEQGCDFDLMVDFDDRVFEVTDADGDGKAEVVLAYRLGCVSDVSPGPLKLMILEGPDKYAVRGVTRVRVSETEWMGGERTLDPALAKAPALRALAEAKWAALVAER
jgi:hypothetical protein